MMNEDKRQPNETASDRAARRRRQQKATDRVCVTAAALVITLVLLLGCVFSLTGQDKAYSENENRWLAGKPRLTFSSLADGKFMKDAETYFSDQFPLRDRLVRARTYIAIFCGQSERNDVYIGKKHFLFEKPAAYEEERMSATLGAIDGVSRRYPDVRSFIAVAPNASEILPELLPHNAPRQDQTAQIQKIYESLPEITSVDLCAAFKDAGHRDRLYYRTDHHWTTAGAELAFRKIAETMGLDTRGSSYISYPVCSDFQGTLASSAGFFRAQDTISVIVPGAELKYTVNYTDEKITRPSVFDLSKLSQKNRYEVFFGGNFAQVRIETDAASDRKLLIVKDSYANCLVPMLLPYFKTVIMVDPRYYRGNFDQLMERETVTDMLWLYNANTLLTDTSIAARM